MAFGINMRAATTWVRKAAKKNSFHISRRDGKVMFSDGRVIVILPTVAAWDVIKALPVPIPEADGNYRIMYGSSLSTDGADIPAVIKRETDVVGKGTRVHDTRLSWRIPENNTTAHLYYIPTGPDGVYAYAVIDETYARLFEDYTEIRVSKNRRVNERSNALTSPIFYYVGDELVGLVLPIYTDYLPEYLRPDVIVTDVVAD